MHAVSPYILVLYQNKEPALWISVSCHLSPSNLFSQFTGLLCCSLPSQIIFFFSKNAPQMVIGYWALDVPLVSLRSAAGDAALIRHNDAETGPVTRPLRRPWSGARLPSWCFSQLLVLEVKRPCVWCDALVSLRPTAPLERSSRPALWCVPTTSLKRRVT